MFQSSVAAGKLLMRAKPVYLKDVEKTYGWSRAMKKLDIDIELSTKFNIKWMKEKFPINTFCSIKIPYILVGIKSFHGRKSDLLCVVEDPSGSYFLFVLFCFFFKLRIYCHYVVSEL